MSFVGVFHWAKDRNEVACVCPCIFELNNNVIVDQIHVCILQKYFEYLNSIFNHQTLCCGEASLIGSFTMDQTSLNQ